MEQILTIDETLGSKQTARGDSYFPIKSAGLTYYLDRAIMPGRQVRVDVRESKYVKNGKESVSHWAKVLEEIVSDNRDHARDTDQEANTRHEHEPRPSLNEILRAIGRITDVLPVSWKESPQGCRAESAVINTLIIGLGNGSISLYEAEDGPPLPDEDDRPNWAK